MDSETESRPLLHSFERETWRSRLRKRWLKIPSEITITGIILGLFLLVVTLLILLENLESTKKDEISLDGTLQASPFKYNKKAFDKSWQEKKGIMKNQKNYKDQKQDKVNNGQMISNNAEMKMDENEGSYDNWEEEVENINIAKVTEEYGKEIDDSWESFLNQEQKDFYSTKGIRQREIELMQLLNSSRRKWKKIDDGWKRLSEQGWKFIDIREVLFDAMKEKEALEKQNVLQSAMNFDQLWKKINDSLEKNHEKGNKEKEKQKDINNDWKNKMKILQSPKVSEKDWEKVDDGLKKLSEQGWQDAEIRDALFKALREEFLNDQNILYSPMNFSEIWENITEKWKKNLHEDTDVEKIQKSMNDKWAKRIKVSQSSEASNKWAYDDGLKTLSDQGWKVKEIKEALIEALQGKTILQSPTNLEKLDDVVEFIKDLQEEGSSSHGKKDIDGQPAKPLQPSMSFNDIDWKEVDDGWKKLSEQGWEDKEIKESLYKAWKDGDKLQQSAVGSNSFKWKKVNDGWKKISNKSIGVPTRCPFSKTYREHLIGSEMSAPRLDCALIAEQVRREYGSCIDLSFLPKACRPSWRTKCFSTYKYRKIDGTCNNQVHPTWGKSGTPFVRMIAPDYADGVSALRTAKNGGPLPNPRFLSRKLYSKQTKPDSNISVLFLYFGLLVDHDIVETGVNSGAIPCCEERFQKNPQNRPKECLQIDVPIDDPFYGPRHVNCLNLVRSFPVNGECAGRREQLNKATSFLDGSAVYGSVIQEAKQLRTFSRGQLRTQLINNTPFMTNAEGAGYSCGTPNEPLKCFEAGDSRVNMMVELTAMHTIWYREHNRIATELHKVNPQWTDEILFQEARRIVVGELQHIMYSSFLPLLLGERAMNQYELNIDGSKLYNGYDETVDSSVFNVFGAAAFRFGHSLAPDMQYLMGPDNSILGKIALHETFFNANVLYHNGLDLLLRGAAGQRTQSVDSYITPEVREHLFQPADMDYGHDLAAVGIQRGRDHGLPSYVQWRAVCGLTKVESWNDLYEIMDKERADMLQNVYQSVEDIDLIPGALAESPETECFLGPTYICLIGRQFKKTRKGDRFWFEIQNEKPSFTKGQLDQIYKSNMARIICDNSDNITKIQRDPFKVPSDQNPILDCNAVPKVDMSAWKFNNSLLSHL